MGDCAVIEAGNESKGVTSMRELIQGAYDLHVHSAPDVMPRKLDDLEMARRVIEIGRASCRERV